jgi:hypothetical protein
MAAVLDLLERDHTMGTGRVRGEDPEYDFRDLGAMGRATKTRGFDNCAETEQPFLVGCDNVLHKAEIP